MDGIVYGVLRKNACGEFVYFCCECDESYKSGFELEHHISLVHEPDEHKEKVEWTKVENGVQTTVADEVDKKESPQREANDSNADKFIDYDDDGFAGDDGVGDEDDNDDNEHKPSIGIAQLDLPTSYDCDICGNKYTVKETLDRHKRLRHTGNKELCSICGGQFADIKGHMRSHSKVSKKDKRYKCEVCNAVFSHSSYINIHMRTHTGQTPYMCSICGRTFNSQGKLTHHTKRHSDVKQHQCDQCDRAYHERFQLKRHINIVHNGIRMFSCTICDTKKFTTKKSLGQHMLLHGDKRHKCKFCDKK